MAFHFFIRQVEFDRRCQLRKFNFQNFQRPIEHKLTARTRGYSHQNEYMENVTKIGKFLARVPKVRSDTSIDLCGGRIPRGNALLDLRQFLWQRKVVGKRNPCNAMQPANRLLRKVESTTAEIAGPFITWSRCG